MSGIELPPPPPNWVPREGDKCPGCIQGNLIKKHTHDSGLCYYAIVCDRCRLHCADLEKKGLHNTPLPVGKGKCVADQIKIYMDYFFDEMKIDQVTRKAATDFYVSDIRGNDRYLLGKNPRTVAASICYLLCRFARKYGNGPRVTQNDCSFVLNLAPATLQRSYRELQREFFGAKDTYPE